MTKSNIKASDCEVVIPVQAPTFYLDSTFKQTFLLFVMSLLLKLFHVYTIHGMLILTTCTLAGRGLLLWVIIVV